MINHARTLLLNQPGKNYLPGTLGEEYTPRDFAPVHLPSYVLFPHKILFGADPDKVFLNFRARELLGLVHATELEEFIYRLDPRVTYWPEQRSDFFSATRAVSFTKTSGYPAAKLYLRGQPVADNNRGRAFNDYFIRLLDDDVNIRAAITANSSYDAVVQQISLVTEGGKLSNPVAIPGSNLSAQFTDVEEIPAEYLMLEEYDFSLLAEDYNSLRLEIGEILPFTFAPSNQYVITAEDNVVASWQVQTYARPSDAITACLPRLELLGEPLFLELFGVRNDVEPYATFKKIWFEHPMPNYRLAAFVLAMIYRTAEAQR